MLTVAGQCESAQWIYFSFDHYKKNMWYWIYIPWRITGQLNTWSLLSLPCVHKNKMSETSKSTCISHHHQYLWAVTSHCALKDSGRARLPFTAEIWLLFCKEWSKNASFLWYGSFQEEHCGRLQLHYCVLWLCCWLPSLFTMVCGNQLTHHGMTQSIIPQDT